MTYQNPLSSQFNALVTVSGATVTLPRSLGLMSYGHSEHDESSIHCGPVVHYLLVLPMLIFGTANFRGHYLAIKRGLRPIRNGVWGMVQPRVLGPDNCCLCWVRSAPGGLIILRLLLSAIDQLTRDDEGLRLLTFSQRDRREVLNAARSLLAKKDPQ